MRAVKISGAFLTVFLLAGLFFEHAKADTFYATLVPMTTPVTLSASVTELTIGTSTSLTYGGGDGTGGYRFNNSTSSFCSVNINGVVSANYPGQCSFTVTRLATGKYIDTTSSAVSIMALPEPDKSFISAPEPDPTPTPRATRSATPTPTANPVSVPVAVITRDATDVPTTKATPVPLVKKVTGLKASLIQSEQSNGFKFSWGADKQAISYSVTILTGTVRTNYETKAPTIDVKTLTPGSYTVEITAIDSKGKLSPPVRNKFVIAEPTTVKLTAMMGLSKPEVTSALAKSLDSFISKTTLGYPVEIVIEYPKSAKNSVAQARIASSVVTKYLKDKKPGTQVNATMKAIEGQWDFLTVQGMGKKQRSTLLISRG